MNSGNIRISAAFMILGVALIVFAMPLERPRHIPYGPDLFPNLVGVGMIVFGLISAIRSWRGLDTAPPSAGERRLGLPAAGFLAAPLLFVIAAPVLGYLILMPLLLGGLIGLMRGWWVSSFAIGAGIAFALQVLFQQVMLVPLPWGILEPYAGVLTWM